jgi:hypothetical protein
MTDIVTETKKQFARIFETTDWNHLLDVADYHFQEAAHLKTRNIRFTDKQLLIRNSMKRLHLGVGVELALKAAYLKKGICVNKFKGNKPPEGLENSPIHKLSELDRAALNSNDTFTMDSLINKLASVFELQQDTELTNGLKIAMTFRNKEGHTSFPKHEFMAENYKSISASVIKLYKIAFNQTLDFNIAMQAKDVALFEKT